MDPVGREVSAVYRLQDTSLTLPVGHHVGPRELQNNKNNYGHSKIM